MGNSIDTEAAGKSEPSRLAWLALGLFMGGLVLPFVAYFTIVNLISVDQQVAIRWSASLGLACEIAALVLGLVKWRYAPAKIAGIGSRIVIGLVLLGIALFIFR